MIRRLLLAVLVMACSTSAFALGRISGYVSQGGQAVTTGLFLSSTKVMKSYPGATVTVYAAGTTNLSTIYNDNVLTAKANPFTASSTDASWWFYALDGDYDVKFSGTGITTPWTLSALHVSSSIGISVTSYNAKCDGVTDDSTAFTNAATAANATGGTIYIPATTTGCLLSSSWSMNNKSNFTVRGDGYNSLVKCNVADTCIGGATTSNLVFENFRVGGVSSRAMAFISPSTAIHLRHMWVTGANQPSGSGGGVNSWFGFQGVNCNDCRIEDSIFSGNGQPTDSDSADIGFTTTVSGNSRPVIRNNIATSSVRENIFCQDCDEPLIEGNYAANAINNSANTIGGYGITVYQNSAFVMNRARIIGNTVKNTQGTGIYMAAGAQGLYNVIADNIVENAAQTQTATSLPVGSIAVLSATDSAVTGNVVRGSARSGIILSTTAKSTISSNQVLDYGTTGIELRGSCHDNNIIGNTVTATAANSQGIGQNGTWGVSSNSTLISGNKVQAAGASAVGISILVGFGNRILNNTLYGSTAFITDTATATNKRGNMFTTTGTMSGTVALVAGTKTVSTIEVQAGDTIILTNVSPAGTAIGIPTVGTITGGTSFVINSMRTTNVVETNDTSTIYWEIVH